MQLSMQTDYALRALFTLASHEEKRPLSIHELARRNDIPKRFLEHIMLQLKRKEWVRSTSGKFGGYHLARPPDKITMGEVVRYFDGTLAPIGCVSITDYRCCSQESICRFRRVMLEARNTVVRLMDSTTLADVLLGSPVKHWELHQGIHGEGI